MSRIVFFVLLALAIYLGWRLWQKKKQLPPGDASAIARLPMVSCDTCGLHVPRNEAVIENERYFCCEEHRRPASPGPD